ncbi:MAG: glycoside hydrolase family 16 protein [Clostridiales bacterium]|jgi:hypothetical protein|nr:glycoside hydrolase family 16 protein [Clostridiales bacterium]
MKKRIALFALVLIFFVSLLAGCNFTPIDDGSDDGGQIIIPDDGSTTGEEPDGDPDDDDPPPEEEPDTDPPVSPWLTDPVVKNTFYSAFGSSETLSADWSLVNYGWGQNGVSKDNAGYSRSPGVLNAIGATGGVIVLSSYGDYYHDASKRGQGGVLISNGQYGPGLYEIRMKVVPRFGPCSTAWSYYTNSYAVTNNAGSQVYGHNTADNIQYHEIDIEAPKIGQGFKAWGGVAYEEYYQDANNLNSKGEGAVVNRSKGVTADCEGTYNDGQWHTFAFEWRTAAYDNNEAAGENEGAIIWFMDGKEVARTAMRTPYYPCQLWVGNWFPDNATDWLGIADYDEAYMYLDWVRITEYDDPVRLTNKSDGSLIKPDLGGCVAFSTTGGNTNYAANLPVNNYISNGEFLYGSGAAATGWTLTAAARASNKLQLSGGGRAVQSVSAQYGGYGFDLDVSAGAVSGSGDCRVYVEYISGVYAANSNSNAKMTATTVGQSEALILNAGGEQKLKFSLPAGLNVNNLRVVIETDSGVTATIERVTLRLSSDVR